METHPIWYIWYYAFLFTIVMWSSIYLAFWYVKKVIINKRKIKRLIRLLEVYKMGNMADKELVHNVLKIYETQKKVSLS